MKCQPDCACGRHDRKPETFRQKKCPVGCSCGRHAKHAKGCPCGRCRGKVHEDGCSCGLCARCPIGCSCGKHRNRAGGTNGESTYWTKHRWVSRERGLASNYPCVACGGVAKEWSQIHGTDGADPQNHYRPMCKSCHGKYDASIRTVSEETKAKLSQARKEWWERRRKQDG